jgi:FKBP-type peptidyl-prolyl cis-trans isomerase
MLILTAPNALFIQAPEGAPIFKILHPVMRWACFILMFVSLFSCVSQRKATGSNTTEDYITTASGLKYKIVQRGSGETAKAGQDVLIFETTSYLDGTVLYSNENTANPVRVLIGGNQATDAVDEGLRGMQVGEIRHLLAPPHLVKRKSYPPNVSPDSALAIKIILHKIL